MKKTLKAVLCAVTVVSALSSLSPAQGVTAVSFTEDEITVPPVVQERITTYVDLLADNHDKILTSLQSALNNFETTMSFASAKEANPNIFGAMTSEIFNQGAETLFKKIPGLYQAKKVFSATTAELARAGKASASLNVGEWVKTQRSVIDKRLRGSTSRATLEEIKDELEEAYIPMSPAERDRFLDQLTQGVRALSGPVGPSIDELEVQLYEQWIHSHYRHSGYVMTGLIEYRMEFDDGRLTFKSCHVKAPFGDKVDSALNHLLLRGVPSFRRPFDLRVNKRVCVYTDGSVPGGKLWDCGAMSADNVVYRSPLYEGATRVMNGDVWRDKPRFTVD